MWTEADTNEHPVLHAGHPTPQFGGDIFGEWRIFIDGTETGSRDWAHVFLRLKAENLKAENETSATPANHSSGFSLQPSGFQLFLAEAFGGPTRAGAGGGPALHGVPTLPEPPAQQRILPEVTVGLWREDVFQLAMDARTLLDLRDQLAPDSLRVAEIDAGLRDFTLIADPELPWPQMRPTLLRARERLAPLLACRNGSTAPTLFCIGHSHLDIVYQWPLTEAERKVARTFANQLGLMEQYPEYRYLQSMPVLYEIAKRLHPRIYTRVKDAVRRGQWIPEGGMWTEADTNLPGGESLIRQFLYGRRFFRDEFGTESTFAWLPDTFGFTGSLPQIMAGCGIRHFGTAKPFTVFAEEGEPFPYTTFWWEGIDGTRILSHVVPGYGIMTNPRAITTQWKQNPQKDGIRARMAIYGHSDGGGGCERAHLEYLRRETDLEGLPRCRHATPAGFFEYQEKQPEPLPAFAGELYLPAHRGCYTTQAALKRGNRLCETMLREAELWSAVAHLLTRRHATAAATAPATAPWPRAALEAAWKKTLFNQFHDILPGSCIERAAKEARELYDESLAEATALADVAMRALGEWHGHPAREQCLTAPGKSGAGVSPALESGTGFQPVSVAPPLRNGAGVSPAPVASPSPLRRDTDIQPEARAGNASPTPCESPLLFNSLAWSRTALVSLPSGFPSDALPADIPVLRLADTTWIEATVPACGWCDLPTAATSSVAAALPSPLPPLRVERTTSGCIHIENTHYRLVIDSLGRITSWRDKTGDRELAAAPLNDFRMYRDTPRVCDAWEIESHYAQQPVDISLTADGAPAPADIEILPSLPSDNADSSSPPLAAVIRIRRRLHNSDLEQEIRLARNSRRIEFRTRIRWHEKHKLLKVAFPLALTTHEALHEIQFGHLRRPTHRSRKADQDRFEVCQQKWSALAEENRGVALLNDCKHGISAEQNTLGLTLLRAPQAPDMTADIGDHEFTYALYAWNGPFVTSGVTQQALELCTPLRLVQNAEHPAAEAPAVSRNRDGEPDAGCAGTSLFFCDAPNVILETVKLAEDDSGDLVLRLYEASRATTRCHLRINLPSIGFRSACETDMLETSLPGRDLPPPGTAGLRLDFRPFEIKTVRLRAA
ncbi:MAG: glycosyl hydrolase-related protein [Opitutaceae bacterium]|jgi:alpha-mannosidase|nr:glycosyl hydrolase-related protein [Opitutaceae bacterium]